MSESASTSQPGLTFAVPFYRGVGLLERALASVLRQRHPGWRVLVCDDSGPGGAGEGGEGGAEGLVRRLADPRISYHRNPRNLGMAANWNRCLDLARTDLVTLLHADDELLPDYAGLMAAAAGRHPHATAFFCRAVIIDAAGRPCFSFPDWYKRFLQPPAPGGEMVLRGPRALEALLRGNFIMCPTVCYRKAGLGGRRFPPGWKQVQDLAFFARLLLGGDTLVGLTAAGYAYRRHAGSATEAQTESLLRFEEEARLYDALAAEAAGRGWGGPARVARGKRVILLHLLYRLLLDVLRLRGAAAGRKWAFLRRLLAPAGAAAPAAEAGRG